ncbi:MAG: glycosyltransferase family 39 protein, partial [Acidobacteriota bacterium]
TAYGRGAAAYNAALKKGALSKSALNKIERIGSAIVLAIAAWFWLTYFNRNTNLLDEGSTAAQALRIINGDLIYRDFFTVVTPGSYYTVAWLFRIFGEQLMVLRWAALVTGLAIFVVSYLIARRVSAWPFAAAAALMTTMWGWFLGTPNFYSLAGALFSLIALFCYVHGAPSRRWMIFAGIATGFTVLFKQNTGAYTFAGLLITTWTSRLFDTENDWRGRMQMSAQIVLGICIPVIPVLAWLIVSGAGPYLYESWVYYPLAKYPARFARPFPDFLPIGSDPFDLWIKLVIYMPVVVYPLALIAIAWTSWRFQKHRDLPAKHEGHALLAIAVVGMFTLLQSWPRADVTHILFGLQPTFIVFGYLCYCIARALSAIPGPRQPIATVSLIVALIVALLPMLVLLRKGYQRTDWEYQNYIVGLRTDRGRGIFAGGLEAQRIDTVTKYITDHTAPDDPVFVVPWASGFNFLTRRANPTRIDFMLFEDPEAYPCLLASLDRQPPKYVIYGYTWDVDDQHFRDYAAPVDQYIRSRYTIESTTDGYEIWRRMEGLAAPGEFPRACQPRRFRLGDLWKR